MAGDLYPWSAPSKDARQCPTPTAAMLVIGDEILSWPHSGISNMHHLAGVLTKKGIDLAEVRVVADDRRRDCRGSSGAVGRLGSCLHFGRDRTDA